jgi:hypothetical protein
MNSDPTQKSLSSGFRYSGVWLWITWLMFRDLSWCNVFVFMGRRAQEAMNPWRSRDYFLFSFLIFRWLRRAVLWEGKLFLCTPRGLAGECSFTTLISNLGTGCRWLVQLHATTVLPTGPRAVLTLWSRQKSYHCRDWNYTILDLSRLYPSHYTDWALILR